MKEVMSIDALYQEIKKRGCDLVICNDAPLSTALNNRIDTARLGIFAVTPRQLAAKLSIESIGEPIINDVVLAKRVSDDTGYSLKYVHGEITNFKTAARYTAEPRMGKKSRRIWNAYNYYNTLEKLMRRLGTEQTVLSEFYSGRKTAVVGLELFDDLDKNMFPPDGEFEEVEIFTGGSYEVAEFRSLGNDRLIAECAADIARRCGPENVAIVMDVGGPIANAVKSSLYRIGLPFINSLPVRDLGNIRNYLEFLHLALTYRTISVREVRELLRAYGGEISSRYDRYNFSRFCEIESISKSDMVVRISEAMRNVGEMKFHEMAMFVPSGQRSSIIMLLDQMDCIEKTVTADIVNDLFYAVNNIVALQHNEQIPAEEKSGVLLVDCKNSVFIDRPVVVYTGMCSEWDVSLNNLDYVDPKKKSDIDMINTLRFISLIQQGTARFYLVNANKGGKKAVPCRYFDAAVRPVSFNWEDEMERPPVLIEGFEQLGRVVEGPWKIEKKDRRGYRGDEQLDHAHPVLSFSNSAYMNFMECPRKYLYSQLSGSTENDKTHTGNMIHAFAEFRAAYPELVEQNGIDYYVDEIVRQCAMLTSPDAELIERSRIATEMKVIDEFIEKAGVVPSLRDDPDTDNYLVKMHGLTQTSENTEIKLVSRESEMNGKVDLFWDGVIYDYKTGRYKNIEQLAKDMDISKLRNGEKDNGHKSCQALFYLCLIVDNALESTGRFDLLYAENRYNKLLAGMDADLESCISRVELVDSMDDLVERHAGSLLGGKSAETTLGYYRDLKSVLGDNPTVWTDAEEDQLNSLASAWGLMNAEKPTKKGRDAVSKIIEGFAACAGDLYTVDGFITVKRSMVERFRTELHEDMARLREYYDTSFPCRPLIDCNRCEFRDMCTGAEDIEGGEEVESE